MERASSITTLEATIEAAERAGVVQDEIRAARLRLEELQLVPKQHRSDMGRGRCGLRVSSIWLILKPALIGQRAH